MIYRLTYLSEGLKVKGYFGIPGEYEIGTDELQAMIGQCFGLPELPVTEIASSLLPNRKDIRSSRLPALIYCRGGIGKVGMVKAHWIVQFCSLGYVVIAPSYRGNEGGEGRDEFGGGENEDVLSAFRVLERLPFVDSSRIAVMGFSRGAINAAQTAASETGIQKLILWSGVSDLAQTYEERVDLRRMLKRVIGGSPAKRPDAYRSRSPLHMAGRIRCPVLIMHGTNDVQVDYSHGLGMYAALKRLGADVEMHSYQGYGHHFPLPVHEAAVERMCDWIGFTKRALTRSRNR